MKYTESHFGLIKIGNKISSDGGKTFLPKYSEMTSGEFNELLNDIEYWKENLLSDEEISDLKEILE